MKVSVVKNAGAYHPVRGCERMATGEGSTTTSGNAILLSGDVLVATREEVA
jgi:hypothetical protein